MDSILYQQIASWQDDEGKKKGMTIIVAAVGKKKERTFKLKTDEPTQICEFLMQKAMDLKKAAKDAKKAAKSLTQELLGEYKVLATVGVKESK